MTLLFDTETTGKNDWKAPAEAPQQPDLVQLGAMLVNEGGSVVGQVDLIVEPDGWVIPDEAAGIHHITTTIAKAAGVPRKIALATFNHLCKHADVIVAHNMDFDHAVMLTQYLREKVPHRMTGIPLLCTMKAAAPHCKLPKKYATRNGEDQYKWPSLMEAHEFYLGKPFENAHSAMSDCIALFNIYWEMRHRGHIQVAKAAHA